MSDADYIAGLRDAHRVMTDMQKRLAQEYGNTRASFGFLQSRRHIEISGASDALVALGFELLNLSTRRLDGKRDA